MEQEDIIKTLQALHNAVDELKQIVNELHPLESFTYVESCLEEANRLIP